MNARPDVIVLVTDQERAAPPYETAELSAWRQHRLIGARWFEDHGVSFRRHYTGSLACVPSRPTMFTGQFPDVHGVTQTNGLGKMADDSRMRWLRPGEVPTLGHWFRAGGYDATYVGKWHMSHADLTDPATGSTLATHSDEGVVDEANVQAYLEADPLDEFGFSGWVGPDPHGPDAALSGVVCDPVFAERAVEWLTDRYERRRRGDASARRPFLLVVSFVNPHDIVFAPRWLGRKGPPFEVSGEVCPPEIGPSPTDDEDLASKPAAQIAYRASYPTTYGPAGMVARAYRNRSQEYRNLYYRLHLMSDGPLDRVRRAVTDGGSEAAILVRTADHGELLGAHGGLHQKWFNLYDEATRVPFAIAEIGTHATSPRIVDDAATSHIDLVPTLLSAAGIDEATAAAQLRPSFSELHPLPGLDLTPVIRGEKAPDRDRVVYAMTRDNMPEGDSGASGAARSIGRVAKVPRPLRIEVPAHVAANLEGIVSRVHDKDAPGGAGHLWKLVRTFDDPTSWTEPGVRHLAANGRSGEQFRREPLPDQWELYDLEVDPIEIDNRTCDAGAAPVLELLRYRLAAERTRAVPARNKPWPYATRIPSGAPIMTKPPLPARLVRKLVQRLGMHPDDTEPTEADVAGRRALVIATNHGVLDVGSPTGVYSSELTVPYYAFLDAGMIVDVASPAGGVIPVDPQSLKPVLRTDACDRLLGDDELKSKLNASLEIGALDMADYDIVYLAGGWGAAFDLGFSDNLARQITIANEHECVIGGVCHGPLGLVNAKAKDGTPLVEGRRVTGVTDKQVAELGIDHTPHHPEAELRKAGAAFESSTHRRRDALANHWVVDGNLVTGQNQNAAPMVAREMLRLASERSDRTPQ